MTEWVLFTKERAEKLRKTKVGQKISIDLDKSETTCTPQLKAILSSIPVEELKDGFIYAWNGQQLVRLDGFEGHYFKLRPWKGAPILEIDGLRMQLVKDFTHPFDYGKKIAQLLAIKPGELVLDTCFGLGYVAKALLERGARVVAVEKHPAVIKLGEWNPWTAEVLKKVELHVMPIEEFLKKDTRQYDKIVHDPPRIGHAPYLYSRPFYRALRAHIKPGGLLYHYVGSTGKRRGREMAKEVAKRLEESGWKVVKEWKKGQALIAKPAPASSKV